MRTKKTPKTYDTVKDLEKEFGPRSVGRTLKAFREADGISQTDFARKLGISRSSLCDIEKGRKLVGVKRAAKFARKLGLPESVLVRYAIEEQFRDANLHLRIEVHAA